MKPLLLQLAALLMASAAISAHAGDSLADRHGQRQIACTSCHASGKPMTLSAEASLKEANQACITCHGDEKRMAEISQPKLANRHINPHAGHLVALDCVSCHAGHKPAKAYCLECHEFKMPMPRGKR